MPCGIICGIISPARGNLEHRSLSGAVRGDGRYRPGLRAAADRLHPGQHDGGHGGGLYHMPYVYVMKSWQDYVPEMMAASGFRQAVMGRYPLETVTSLPEYSGLDPDFWEDRRGCGATGQQEDACSGSPIFLAAKAAQ